MRRAMVRAAAAMILLAGVAAFGQQPTGTKKDAKDKKGEQKAAAGSLEDLIAQALRNNADIGVAQAKVREAEAELQRIRVATAQKVAALYRAIETARQSRDTAKGLLATVERQTKTGHASQLDHLKAVGAYRLAEGEVAKLEAELPALLGKMPGKLGEAKAEANLDDPTRAAVASGLRWLATIQKDDAALLWSTLAQQQDDTATSWEMQLLMNSLVKAQPKGSIAERVRKALDTPIKADFGNKIVGQVWDEFRKHLGVSLRDACHLEMNRKLPADFDLGEVPLGVAIQAFNDVFPHGRFLVRDYGILFATKDEVPPGAVELYDFWKSSKRAEESKEAKNPPASTLIVGEVREVDAKSGLVRIGGCNGGDKGLAKGHTLEVYREKPKPIYLGTIRILDVAATEAVGKMVGKPREPIVKGDKVTSRLDGK